MSAGDRGKVMKILKQFRKQGSHSLGILDLGILFSIYFRSLCMLIIKKRGIARIPLKSFEITYYAI